MYASSFLLVAISADRFQVNIRWAVAQAYVWKSLNGENMFSAAQDSQLK